MATGSVSFMPIETGQSAFLGCVAPAGCSCFGELSSFLPNVRSQLLANVSPETLKGRGREPLPFISFFCCSGFRLSWPLGRATGTHTCGPCQSATRTS